MTEAQKKVFDFLNGEASTITKEIVIEKPVKQVAVQVFTDGTLVEKEISDRRFRICKSCPYYFKQTKTCMKCGCFVDMAVLFKNYVLVSKIQQNVEIEK